MRAGRDTDAARSSEPLDAGRDVDAIPVDALSVRDYITHVHADAETHPPVLRTLCVCCLEFRLDGYGASDRVHDAGEFSQDIVTRAVNDPPSVVSNHGGDCLPGYSQRPDSVLLVLLHQPRVAMDIGAQDRKSVV